MEKQSKYNYDSTKPCEPRSRQSLNISSEPQNGITEGTKDIPLGNSINEEIERQRQHIRTSLTILRNLLIEQANMELWSWFEMITKGMR